VSVIHGAHVAGVTLRIDSKPRPGGGRWGAMGLKGAAATSPPERPRLSSNLTATSERRRSDPRAADCAWAGARRREYALFLSTAKKPRLSNRQEFGVGGSEISARKTTTAADWSQTMRYFSWAFFASNSLFAPSRSPTGPRAWVGCGRPSGASLDANLAARPRFRYAPLGARRGLPSAANQAGRVKTSPLRFFSSGPGRIGR
jgi:hypothetical protein